MRSSSAQPYPRQRSARRAEHANVDHRRAQRCSVRRHDTRDQHAVPGAGAAVRRGGAHAHPACDSASGATCTTVATAPAPSAIAGRRSAAAISPSSRIASCSSKPPVPPHSISVAQLTRARTPSPIAARPNTRLSTPRNQRICGEFDAQSRRSHRATIEQDRLLRQPFGRGRLPPRRCASAHARRTAWQRPVESLRRLRRDRRAAAGSDGERTASSSSPPAMPPDVFSVTMSSHPGVFGAGKSRLQAAGLTQPVKCRVAVAPLDRHRDLAKCPLQCRTGPWRHPSIVASAGRCRVAAKPGLPARDVLRQQSETVGQP